MEVYGVGVHSHSCLLDWPQVWSNLLAPIAPYAMAQLAEHAAWHVRSKQTYLTTHVQRQIMDSFGKLHATTWRDLALLLSSDYPIKPALSDANLQAARQVCDDFDRMYRDNKDLCDYMYVASLMESEE